MPTILIHGCVWPLFPYLDVFVCYGTPHFWFGKHFIPLSFESSIRCDEALRSETKLISSFRYICYAQHQYQAMEVVHMYLPKLKNCLCFQFWRINRVFSVISIFPTSFPCTLNPSSSQFRGCHPKWRPGLRRTFPAFGIGYCVEVGKDGQWRASLSCSPCKLLSCHP